MKKQDIKKNWRWFRFVLLFYIIGGVVLYFTQESILFHPQKLASDYSYKFEIPFKEIDYPVTDKKNLSIVQFTVPDSLSKGVVLYFHGNRNNINHYAVNAQNFTRNNYNVWMIDYPGFGKSTGERNEQVLYEDAYRLYKMARKSYSVDSIIIYGKSLGTGIASQLAATRDCKRLILETPYYSIAALAKKYFFIYPVDQMIKYKIPTYRYFEKITAPVTIFHGTRDGIIPYRHAEKLMKKLKSKGELVTIKKGRHNNLTGFDLYQKKLDSLLH